MKADPRRSAMLKTGTGLTVWWSPISGKENIGDFLSLYFLDRVFESTRVAADIYRLVGSVISAGVIRNDAETLAKRPDARIAFWGCGCRDEKPISAAHLAHASFFGVRGPLTREILGLPRDTPLGDPALLLPLVHAPKLSQRTQGKTIFVPHIRDALSLSSGTLAALSGAELMISPIVDSKLGAIEQFIDDVCSAQFVMAGSLHAAIIACAYGVPFSFFDTGYVDQPFKWRDFSASLGIGTYFPRCRRDAEEVHRHLLAGRMKRPPLAPLLRAAPMRPRPDVMARAEAHRWEI